MSVNFNLVMCIRRSPCNNLESNISGYGNGTMLLILHLPPPIHGASVIGECIMGSKKINARFDCHYINLTTAKGLNNIGKFGFKKLYNYLKQLYCIYKGIYKHQPHLVYLTPNSAGIPFYKDFITVSLIKYWCKHLNTKETPRILIHFHNKGCQEFSRSKVNNWLYNHFFKNVYVLLLSEMLYNDVRQYVQENRVVYCGNGIPGIPECVEKRNVRVRKKVDSSLSYNSPINLLFLSNMMEAKGVWTLLNACVELKKKKIDFHCVFVGGWKDITEPMFNDRMKKLGLETRVTAVGSKYGEEKEEYWLNADIFVLPTYNECFPLVLLEAMQHALPCISTAEGAIPDIIDDGVTGFVVEKRNPQQLAARIIELNINRQRCFGMGLKGYEKYKQYYTIDAFEKRICNVFEQLI